MYERIFGPNGTLAERLERFEPRDVQCQMAEAVDRACSEGGLLLLEAGTGVGKSLAYLVPLIEQLAATGQRAVVSTCTKTLQHQLMTKDIPLALEVTGENIDFALGLGGDNYLCQDRLEAALRSGGDFSPSRRFLQWAQRTRTGIRGECPVYVPERIWRRVCRSREFCPPSICKPGGRCFFQRARTAVRKAKLLVVNHYLLFSDLRSGQSILGDYGVLVFDEAHDLEDIATDYLGERLVRGGLVELLVALGAERENASLLDACSLLSGERRDAIGTLANQALSALQQLFTELGLSLDVQGSRQKIEGDLTEFDLVSAPLALLKNEVQAAGRELKESQQAGLLDGAIDRLQGTCDTVRALLGPADDNAVRWVESDERGISAVSSAPVEIGPVLREELFDAMHATIFVSATLRIGKTFQFFKDRTGTHGATEAHFPSPFAYEEQMVLYVPASGPEPQAGEVYLEYLAEQIAALGRSLAGGCFALFTNRQHMQHVHRLLLDSGDYRTADDAEDLVASRLLLCQGEMERESLLKTFREDGNALLLGTNTFWQGVDVPGDALRGVILCRFPFRMPDDPVVEARVQRLKEQGKQPFMEYQVPQAVMMFLQGVGRLIRHRSDTGVVAILDQRMRTKRYGRLFYDSLPACVGTASLQDVAARVGPQAGVCDEG